MLPVRAADAQFPVTLYDVLGPQKRPENGGSCWLFIGFVRGVRCRGAKNGVGVHGDGLALVGAARDDRFRGNRRQYFWLFVAH